MNRHERRKLARNATPDENAVPGSHGPVQAQAGVIMKTIFETLRTVYPGYEMTVFVFEPARLARKEGRAPRFNYASTVNRDDMIAVLEGFIKQSRETGEVLDRINDKPEGSA